VNGEVRPGAGYAVSWSKVANSFAGFDYGAGAAVADGLRLIEAAVGCELAARQAVRAWREVA